MSPPHLVMRAEQHFAVGVDLLDASEGAEEAVVQLLLPQSGDLVGGQLASDQRKKESQTNSTSRLGGVGWGGASRGHNVRRQLGCLRLTADLIGRWL